MLPHFYLPNIMTVAIKVHMILRRHVVLTWMRDIRGSLCASMVKWTKKMLWYLNPFNPSWLSCEIWCLSPYVEKILVSMVYAFYIGVW